MSERNRKILHWLPRILCVAAILFISLFALDAFNNEHSFGQQLLSFLMHLVPSFILTVLLVVAWKWGFVGGVIFIIIGLVFTPLVYNHNFNMNNSVFLSLGIVSMITLPFLIVGFLFVLDDKLTKNEKSKALRSKMEAFID